MDTHRNTLRGDEARDEVVLLVGAIAERVHELVVKVIGRELPITYLTIFSHHPRDYQRLVAVMETLGDRFEANNGVKFTLHTPIQTAHGTVSTIRVREPDPYRSQLGCADVQVEDFAAFKEQELPKHPEHMRCIVRPEYEMIEFFDFDQNDVLAYVMPGELLSKLVRK